MLDDTKLETKIDTKLETKIDTKLETKISNIIEYYIGIVQLIKLYLEDLIKYLENKDKKEEIQKLLSFQSILTNSKKLKNITTDNFRFFRIYNILIFMKNDLSNIISYIYDLDIFDEQTLLSDTSKNNINQNKNVIIDTYKKIQKKTTKILNKILNNTIQNFIITYDSYIELHEFYLSNPNIIKLYTSIIKKFMSTISLDSHSTLILLILYNNQIDKNILLKNKILSIKNLDVNINNTTDFNYLFQDIKIVKNKNFITKFTNYLSHQKYLSIHELFLDIQNSNFKFKSNKIDTSSISTIQKIVNDYYKIERQYLNITIIETSIDKFNYNCKTLLNSKYQLEPNIGINIKYNNKTKTIITNDEYKNLELLYNDYKNEMYLSYFDKMININNFKQKSVKTNINILLESQYILIVKLNIDVKKSEFHILSSNDNIYMNFLHIKPLLQNKPDYIIENYNIIRNEHIINHIENNYMLNSYLSRISYDYKNVPIIDNLELKNLILNNIQNKIKIINQQNKTTNIQIIIDIIINQLYFYIQKTNNIDFSSEIYLTYYSNIHNLISKVNKDLNDNYNEDLLLNLDNILNNIYPNIIAINNHVLDKYYLMQL